MPVTVNLKLIDTQNQVRDKMLKELKRFFSGVMVATTKLIRKRFISVIGAAILDSPEMQSLMSSTGKLKGELGVPNATQRVDEIVKAWLRSIEITASPVKKFGPQLRGGIKIKFIKKNWKDILQLPSASYTTAKGEIMPWLQWLLIEGDRTIINDYRVILTTKVFPASRTGLGLMVFKKNNRWRVPPEFSGTPRNNFVTRSLAKIEPKLKRIIETSLTSTVLKLGR